jgi:hypothetical protein
MGHAESVEKFIAQAGVLDALVTGLSPADLDAVPVPGKWSLRTLAIHIMDSDQFAIGRMKRIIAEDNPLLIAYNETAFAARLFYAQQDLGLVCDLYRAGRLHMGEILRRLPDGAFARTGVHNENGKMMLGGIVDGYVRHVEHHLVFAREKLRALGRAVPV